jgi:hypothetical protein
MSAFFMSDRRKVKFLKHYPNRSLAWRVVRFAASTVLGGTRRGYFIPYRYADALPAPHAIPSYAAIESIFAERLAIFQDVLELADD